MDYTSGKVHSIDEESVFGGQRKFLFKKKLPKAKASVLKRILEANQDYIEEIKTEWSKLEPKIATNLDIVSSNLNVYI